MHTTLLEGNIQRQLLRLALPLLIGSVLQQLYNTVDALIIGSFLGTQAFSAIGLAGSIMNLLIFVLTGFCNGTSVIFGQLYGANDKRAFRREVFVSLALGTAITLVLCALSTIFLGTILRLIQTPVELIPEATAYLRIIILGMMATFFYNLFSGILRAIGDTRAATAFLVVAVTVNAGADLLFVKVFAMGVAGAAWATVLSQLISAALCLAYLLRRDRELICTCEDMDFDSVLVRRTLNFGLGTALQQSSLFIGKIVVQGAVDLLGTTGIAAFTAASRIEAFANSVATSFGQAVTVFMSQNRGAGNTRRIRDGFRKALGIAVAGGIVISALLYITARPGVNIFLKAGETAAIAEGTMYISTVAFFYILCFTGNTFAGSFRGLGHINYTLFGTTLQIIARAVFSHLFVRSMGLRAVAIATGVGWLMLFTFQCLGMYHLRGELTPEKGKS